jgi:outer membrane protein assembly factor BamB
MTVIKEISVRRPIRVWQLLVAASVLAVTGIGITVIARPKATSDGRPIKEALIQNSRDRYPPTFPVMSDPLRPDPEDGWPALFGPYHTSISPETNLVLQWPAAGPPEKWRRRIGQGYGAPVVLGTRLVVFHRLGDQEIVECLEAETGDTLWAFRYPTAYECPVAYSSGPYSTPVLEQGRVYAWGAEGELHCLSLEDGTEIWGRSLNDEYHPEEGLFPVASSPLLDVDRLILNVGGKTAGAGMIALDKGTGETLWTASDHARSCATPRAATIHGRRYIFAFTNEGLLSLDPETGSIWWSIPFRPRNPEKINATSPLIHHDLVLASAYSLGSLCVRVLPHGGYEELWRDGRVLDSQYNNLVCVDGYVYGFSAVDKRRSFRCVDLLTGQLQWKFSSRWLGRGASIAVDGQFILLGEAGHLGSMVISPREPLARSATDEPLIEGPCYTAPALHRGLLYLRNQDTVVCLSLRKADAR